MSDNVAPPQLSPQTPVGGEVLKWPKVLGVLNIVFGVLGVGTGLFSFITPAFTKWMMKLATMAAPDAIGEDYWDKFDAVQARWAWVSYTTGTLFAVANIFLIIGGIACLKHKRNCRPMFMIYSALTFLYLGFSTWAMLGTSMMREQTEVSQIEDLDAAAIDGQVIFSQIIGVASQFFYIVLPIFLIIWFFRRKISTDLEEKFV